MRFKRLKIFVGISLLIFILVVGNILVIGAIQNASSSQNNLRLSAPIYQDNKAQPTTTQTQPTLVVPQQNEPVIFHPTIRTVAS